MERNVTAGPDLQHETTPATSQGGVLPPRELRIVIAGLLIALLLSALDNTIVATAMPTIVGKLGGFAKYTWVTTAYVVTSTIATLMLGKLSDLYGRRRVFLLAIILFLVGSLLCGAAQTMNQLIVFRALQGLGGGGIWGLTFAVVGDLVPPVDRGRYFGLFTGVFAIASVAGPLVGGVIVDHFSWRWIFYVNLPIGLVAFAVVAKVLRLPFQRRDPQLDLVGAVLLCGGIAALMVALEEGSLKGWGSPWIIVLFAATLALLVAFVAQERRTPEPILPMRLFSNDILRNTMLIGFVLGVTMMTAGLFFALYFQDVLFRTPTKAGLMTMPIMLGVLVASTTTGRLISSSGTYRRFPLIGIPVALAGLALATRTTSTSPYLVLALAMLLIGLGVGTTMPTLSIAGQNVAEPQDLGISTASLNFFRSLGSSIGLAVYGTVFNSTVRHGLTGRLPSGTNRGDILDIIREPKKLQALPLAVRSAVTSSIGEGVARVFTYGLIVTAFALLFAVRLREAPLRKTSGMQQQRAALVEP